MNLAVRLLLSSLVIANSPACQEEETANPGCSSPDITLTLAVTFPAGLLGEDENIEDSILDVGVAGPLLLPDINTLSVSGPEGTASAVITGTSIPELQPFTEVSMRVVSEFGETIYVELTDVVTSRLLFAAQTGGPFYTEIDDARVQLTTEEICSSSTGDGGDDSISATLRAVVNVDGVAVRVEPGVTKGVEGTALVVEHQGTSSEEYYESVSVESAIVVRVSD